MWAIIYRESVNTPANATSHHNSCRRGERKWSNSDHNSCRSRLKGEVDVIEVEGGVSLDKKVNKESLFITNVDSGVCSNEKVNEESLSIYNRAKEEEEKIGSSWEDINDLTSVINGLIYKRAKEEEEKIGSSGEDINDLAINDLSQIVTLEEGTPSTDDKKGTAIENKDSDLGGQVRDAKDD